MVVSHCANRVHISAIVGAQTRKAWWKGLQVPIRGLVGFFEDVFGKEAEARTLIAGGHDDHVALYNDLVTRTVLRNTLGALIKSYAVFREFDDVSPKPLCFTGANQAEDVGIDLDFGKWLKCLKVA